MRHWLLPAREMFRCWQGIEVGETGGGRNSTAGVAAAAELREGELADVAEKAAGSGVASGTEEADAGETVFSGGGSPGGSGSVAEKRARDTARDAGLLTQQLQLQCNPAAPQAVATAAIAVATLAKLTGSSVLASG